MAILRGRVLAEADQIGGPAAAVVNQALATQLWPDRDAIGEELSVDGPGGPFVQVVGVAQQCEPDGERSGCRVPARPTDGQWSRSSPGWTAKIHAESARDRTRGAGRRWPCRCPSLRRFEAPHRRTSRGRTKVESHFWGLRRYGLKARSDRPLWPCRLYGRRSAREVACAQPLARAQVTCCGCLFRRRAPRNGRHRRWPSTGDRRHYRAQRIFLRRADCRSDRDWHCRGRARGCPRGGSVPAHETSPVRGPCPWPCVAATSVVPPKSPVRFRADTRRTPSPNLSRPGRRCRAGDRSGWRVRCDYYWRSGFIYPGSVSPRSSAGAIGVLEMGI